MEVEPVKKALLTAANNLSEVSALLGGYETGVHTDLEIEVSHRVLNILSMDAAVGSMLAAQERLGAFRAEADHLAHVCLVARADVPEAPGRRGRRPQEWYDPFTALLLRVAEEAGIEPTLRKDRITADRSGWLLDAGQALESFLYPEMRSPTAEACGKRLERSLTRVPKPKRQKSPAH